MSKKPLEIPEPAHGQRRSDGFLFWGWYKRDTKKHGTRMLQRWMSPEAFTRARRQASGGYQRAKRALDPRTPARSPRAALARHLGVTIAELTRANIWGSGRECGVRRPRPVYQLIALGSYYGFGKTPPPLPGALWEQIDDNPSRFPLWVCASDFPVDRANPPR